VVVVCYLRRWRLDTHTLTINGGRLERLQKTIGHACVGVCICVSRLVLVAVGECRSVARLAA